MSTTAEQSESKRSDEILEKSVDALRKLMLISITISLVWFLSWQKTKIIFERYKSSLQLNAWLNLKEFSNSLPKATDSTEKRELTLYTMVHEATEFKNERDNGIVGYYPKAPYNAIADDSKATPKKLTINAYWPTPTTVPIGLYRHALCSYFDLRDDSEYVKNEMRYLEDGKTMAEFFDVYTPYPKFNFENYELLRLYDTTEKFLILKRHRNGHLVEYNSHHYLVYDSTLAKPIDFDKCIPFLVEAGIDPNIDSLSIKSPSVRSFLLSSSIEALNFEVLGISVPINIAISLFSILIAIIAFSMLGPLSILWKIGITVPIETIWILAMPTISRNRVFNMENLLLVISLLFALLPAFLFLLQCFSGIFGLVNFWLIILNLAATVFSTAVFFSAINFLRRIRKSSK